MQLKKNDKTPDALSRGKTTAVFSGNLTESTKKLISMPPYEIFFDWFLGSPDTKGLDTAVGSGAEDGFQNTRHQSKRWRWQEHLVRQFGGLPEPHPWFGRHLD